MTFKEECIAQALAGLCANPNLVTQNDLVDHTARDRMATAMAEAAVLIGSRTTTELGN